MTSSESLPVLAEIYGKRQFFSVQATTGECVMGWVLTADDLVIEIPDATGAIGTEVLHGGTVPGILVGLGAGPTPTPAQDMAAAVPNKQELQVLIRNASRLGGVLSRHRNFNSHFNSHKKLLENALNTSYSHDRAGEDAFLQDLGKLIAYKKLTPVGIVTLGKNQRMAFAYQGFVNTTPLTAVVFPSGEWNTLLMSYKGKASGFFYQMKFAGNFPFPFMSLNASGGFNRQFL